MKPEIYKRIPGHAFVLMGVPAPFQAGRLDFSPDFSEKKPAALGKNYLFANKNLALSSKTDILYIWNKERRGIYEYQP